MTRPCGNPGCSASTGICERTTYGSGKLDANGYWEFPCPICARYAEGRDGLEPGTYWPPVQGVTAPAWDARKVADELLERLNDFALDWDSHEYGLPYHDEAKDEMAAMVLAAFARVSSEELQKLRGAVRDAGFSVMQTSGKWSLHYCSEAAKKAEEVEGRLISRNIDLERRVRELEAELEHTVNLLRDLTEAVENPPERLWVVHTIRDHKVYGTGLVTARTPLEAVRKEKQDLYELENGRAGWHHEPGDLWPLKPGDYFAVTPWQEGKALPDPAYT